MASRQIIQIDEEKCDGCGQCIPNCAEGSLKIINGKAKLVSDNLCDGLGACLGHCPQDALKIIEREAEEFDEEAVEAFLAKEKEESISLVKSMNTMECGCPSTQVAILGSPKPEPAPTTGPSTPPAPTSSSLGHWPVKLRLVPESAPFLEGAHLLVLADCAAVAAHDLHQSLLKDKAVVILCPKFEDPGFYRPKMRALVAKANLSAITVAHMEVPCCSGLYATVKEAVEASGKNIPLERLVLSRDGKTRRI